MLRGAFAPLFFNDMNKKFEKKTDEPQNIQKRDASSSKKRIKIALIIIASALAVLLALTAVLPLIEKAIEPDVETSDYEDYRFYEIDYSANLLENQLYLNHSRAIRFADLNTEYVLKEENASSISPSAKFFYDFFDRYFRYFVFEFFINIFHYLIPFINQKQKFK